MIQQRSSLESFVQPFNVEVPDLGHLERAFTHTHPYSWNHCSCVFPACVQRQCKASEDLGASTSLLNTT